MRKNIRTISHILGRYSKLVTDDQIQTASHKVLSERKVLQSAKQVADLINSDWFTEDQHLRYHKPTQHFREKQGTEEEKNS